MARTNAPAPRYNEMDPAGREGAFDSLNAMVEAQLFGSRAAQNGARSRVDGWRREQRFIARVARKMGDAWAMPAHIADFAMGRG